VSPDARNSTGKVGYVPAVTITIAAPPASPAPPQMLIDETTGTLATTASIKEASEAPVTPAPINTISKVPADFDSVNDSKAEPSKHFQEQLRLREASYKSSNLNSMPCTNAGARITQSKLECPEEEQQQKSSTKFHLQQSNVQDEDPNQECSCATMTDKSIKIQSDSRDRGIGLLDSNEVPQIDQPSVLPSLILQWVDSTEQANGDPITPAESQCISTLSNRVESILETDVEYPNSTRAMVMEIMSLFHDHNQPCKFDLDDLQEDSGYCPEPTTDGSDSSQSGTRSASAQSGTSTMQSGLTTAFPREFFKSLNRGDDEGPPNKRSRGNHDPSPHETSPASSLKSQMPCPMSTSLGCLGTNPTISEMLRSLQNRHRIVICTDCCFRLEVADQERKLENVLKRHISTGCERKCISQSCQDTDQDTLGYHRKTEKCPNWKAIPKEVRWSFVWGLLNPGLEPPSPDFISSVGYEHSTVLTRCKEKTRNRGLELCRTVLADLDAKAEQIQSLEHKLVMSHQHNSEIQRRSDEKITNLENIIETLLERLRDRNVDIPPSLQKRLARECPGCLNTSSSSQFNKPPTPESTPEKGTFVGNSTGLSDILDPCVEIPLQRTATLAQQARIDIFGAMTSIASTHIAKDSAVLSDLAFEEFLSASMDANVESESNGTVWGV
jgi:hypothetical protein